VKPRKTGIGRNPRTGAEVSIPPGKALRFKPGKELQTLAVGCCTRYALCPLRISLPRRTPSPRRRQRQGFAIPAIRTRERYWLYGLLFRADGVHRNRGRRRHETILSATCPSMSIAPTRNMPCSGSIRPYS